MENKTEKPYKLHPETYRNTLNSSRETAEILRDSVELLERSITASEKAAAFPGLVFVDDDGRTVKHIRFDRGDLAPLKARLGKEKERLSVVENFIQELVDENEENVV